MRMNKLGLTAAIGLTLGTSSPIGGEALASGPLQPPRVEVAYAFECPDIRATVRYREDRSEPVNVPRPEDLQVTLLELTVSGASLPPDQLATAGEVFRSFAWVSSLRALCYSGRRVSVGLYGMPLRPFMDYLRDDGPTPALVHRSFILSASGLEPLAP
jgi:hypothetical protein